MMKKACLLALALAFCAWAQESSDSGLDEFERSLVPETAADSAVEAPDEFEQSLIQHPSEMEPVYKTREEDEKVFDSRFVAHAFRMYGLSGKI